MVIIMRIHWDEKAKRLAEKYDMYDVGITQIEVALTQPNGILGIGIETDDGRNIMWTLKNNWIVCKVSTR